MRKLLIMILSAIWCGLALAGTTQVSMVSNSNQTPVINDNFDVLQNGVNTLQGSYNTVNGYFGSGVLSVAHGGTGQTTTNAALMALLPNQSGHAGQFLGTDGSIYGWATVATPVYLGSWVSKSLYTSYQAATDGFVIEYEYGSSNAVIYTDSSNPPTTVRGACATNGGSWACSTMTPVKKNDYYKAEGSGATNLYFISLGN